MVQQRGNSRYYCLHSVQTYVLVEYYGIDYVQCVLNIFLVDMLVVILIEIDR